MHKHKKNNNKHNHFGMNLTPISSSSNLVHILQAATADLVPKKDQLTILTINFRKSILIELAATFEGHLSVNNQYKVRENVETDNCNPNRLSFLKILKRLIDWFEQHVKLPKVILCLEIRESLSLYVRIYIFCVVVSESFFCTWFYQMWIILEHIFKNPFI